MVSHTGGLTTFYQSPRRQGTSGVIWRNLRLKPATIFGIFEKERFDLIFYFLLQGCAEGLKNKIPKDLYYVSHTGGLTTILPVSTAAWNLW
jgi:hypothetical protein